MKTIFSILIIALFSISFAQKTQNLGEFNFVEVFDKIPVTLVKSDKDYIEISGSRANEVELITKNQQLKIRMNTKNLLKGDEVKVILYYQGLNEIHANEGAYISSENPISASTILLNAKEGAEIRLPIETNSLEIKTNTGGKIYVNGTADFQSVISNSGGIYDGEKLETAKTEVTVNAGGEAKVYATESVNAKTRAGGNIHIFGGAQVTQEKIAGGKVHIH
ncbi:head GIN domain-containing protein [Moheibacter sediminis]|uniref:Putative auto-transporter adhesin, head GIN domain n=1 Tax=Moheibacter sediminis TaxID=1434700 RepID=A0A1W2CH70_9FLAO|nr:head GIN domain-containing protein [Moheibacter sediminis]SMC84530.1 Putative auto-transporter adhesin, head GIN domain [Moheibacter sediminis]